MKSGFLACLLLSTAAHADVTVKWSTVVEDIDMSGANSFTAASTHRYSGTRLRRDTHIRYQDRNADTLNSGKYSEIFLPDQDVIVRKFRNDTPRNTISEMSDLIAQMDEAPGSPKNRLGGPPNRLVQGLIRTEPLNGEKTINGYPCRGEKLTRLIRITNEKTKTTRETRIVLERWNTLKNPGLTALHEAQALFNRPFSNAIRLRISPEDPRFWALGLTALNGSPLDENRGDAAWLTRDFPEPVGTTVLQEMSLSTRFIEAGGPDAPFNPAYRCRTELKKVSLSPLDPGLFDSK